MVNGKLNDAIVKLNSIILLLIVLYSALRSTIFSEIMGLSDRVFVVLIPILLAGFTVCFFMAAKEEKLNFLKANLFVVIYLAVRIFATVINGFNHYAIGSIMYETTFLLLICQWTIGKYEDVKRMSIVFVGFNFVINVLSVFSMVFYNQITSLGFDTAAYHDGGDLYTELHPYAGLYVNPNTAGIMTAIALLVFIPLVQTRLNSEDKTYKKVGVALYVLFAIYMMHQFGCRSAMVSVIAVVVIYAIVKIFNFNKNRALQICLAFIVLCNIALVGIIELEGQDSFKITNSIDKISTGRYDIWKDSYNTAKYMDVWALGHGSNEQELENRNIYLKEQWANEGETEELYSETVLGIHNGYLGVLYNTGILCFILFCLIMWLKISRMKCSKNNNWWLVVLFTIFINNFESLMIMNKFYTCFFMMIVLAMNDTDEMENYKRN